MIAIEYPIPCTYCKNPMENYTRNARTGKLVFTCGCGKSLEVTENEYLSILQKESGNK